MGKQYALMRDNRIAALKFFIEQTRLPGMAGYVARTLHTALLKAHRDPTLNAFDKEREFKRILRQVNTPEPVPAGAGVPADSPGPLPVVAGSSTPYA